MLKLCNRNSKSLPPFGQCCRPKSGNLRILFIWLLGIMIMVGLMIYEILPLFYQYKYNNVATKMEIISKNETIIPPLLTFCIPYAPVSLEALTRSFQNSKTHSEERKKLMDHGFLKTLIPDENITFGTGDVQKWQISNYLLRELLENSNFHALDTRNAAWNQPIIESIWDMFACIGQFDNDAKENHTCIEKYDFEMLLSQKFVIESMYESVMDFLCEHIRMGEKNKQKEYQCLYWLKQNQSHTFNDQFCFELPLQLLETDGFSITVDSMNKGGIQFLALTETNSPFYVFSGSDLLLWPLGNPEVSHAVFTSFSSQKLAKAQETAILKYVIDSSVSTKMQNVDCYEERTPEECIANCVDQKRIDCYQCVPFTFRKSPRALDRIHEFNDTPYCNCTHYSLTNCNYDYEDTCRQECRNPCRYIRYQWQITENTVIGKTSRIFTLKIKAMEAPYVQFDLIERQSWEQFVSSLAGLINLFLGFSGATIVGLIIHCFRFCSRQKLRAKIADTAQNDETKSAKSNVSARPSTDQESTAGSTLSTFMAKVSELDARLQVLEGGAPSSKKWF